MFDFIKWFEGRIRWSLDNVIKLVEVKSSVYYVAHCDVCKVNSLHLNKTCLRCTGEDED